MSSELPTRFGISAQALRRRPYLHLDPDRWPRLRQKMADRPSAALQLCRHDSRPGPNRPPRFATTVLEASAFLAAVSDSRGDRQWLTSHLDVVLASRGMDLIGVMRGHFLAALAFAYDLLGDVLDEPELAALRRTLTDHATRAAEAVRSGFGDDWPRESPKAVATLAGLNLAGLSLLGEEPGAVDWVAVSEPRLVEMLGSVAVDGWWPTGFEDWNLLLPLLVRVADAWQRLAGRNLFDHGLFREAWATALHGVVAQGDVLDLDQVGEREVSRRAVMTAPHPEGFYRWRHEPCLWALDRLASQFSHHGFRAAAARWRELGLGRGTPWAVLFEPPRTSAEITSSEPTHHLFDDHGLAVWRSDWQPDATTIALATGPAYGARAQEWLPTTPLDADANHLLVFSGGKLLAGEAARAGGRASAMHNTVLLDGVGQVEPAEARSPARLEAAWQTSIGGALAGEADGTYPPAAAVQQFRRHLLFGPDYVLVWDRLASQKPSRYEWRLHTHGRIETGPEGLPRLVVPPMALAVQALRPSRLQTEPGLARTAPEAEPVSAVLRLTTSNAVRQTQFLVLLVPCAAEARCPVTGHLLTGDTTVGARLTWANGVWEEALFPTGERGIQLDGLLSDAAAVALRRGPSGDWTRLLARRAGEVLIPGSAVLRATQPVDVGLVAAAEELTGEISSRTGATVTIRCPFEPRGAMVDGQNAHARVERLDRLISVRLTAGRHRVQISSR